MVNALPGLKFLDSTRVTVEERAEAMRVGHLMKVAKPEPATQTQADKGKDEMHEEEEDEEDIANPTRGKVSFGVSRYVYYGKQSEGNRFITNDEL